MEKIFGDLPRKILKPIEEAIEGNAPHRQVNALYQKFSDSIEGQRKRDPRSVHAPSLNHVKVEFQKLTVEGVFNVTTGRRGNADTRPVDAENLPGLMYEALNANASGEYIVFDVAAN